MFSKFSENFCSELNLLTLFQQQIGNYFSRQNFLILKRRSVLFFQHQLYLIVMEKQKQIDKVNKQDSWKNFQPNYLTDTNPIFRFLLFSHAFDLTAKLHNKFCGTNKQQISVDIEDVPNISYEDSIQYYSSQIQEQIYKQLNFGEITVNKIALIFIRVFKKQFFLTWLFLLLQSVCRIVASYFIQSLITSLLENNLKNAYLDAGLLFIFLLFFIIFYHNGYNACILLNCKIRSYITFIINKRVSKLSKYTIKHSETGKIINMMASDFNVIQSRFNFIFKFINLPFVYIISSILLVMRFGWWGILCNVISILLIPFQAIFGNVNGKHLQQLNTYKDTRIKITNDVIEGIRLIKLYGWEIAFKRILSNIRSKETNKHILIYLNQSIERAFSNNIIIWATLAIFIIITLKGQEELNSAKIFSTMDLIIYVRTYFIYSVMGMNFLFHMKEILKRFVDIINIQDIKMRRIDQKNPQMLDESISSLNRIINDEETIRLQKGQVVFKNFNGYWNTKDFTTPNLKNLNICFQQGKFYGITGKVGSGKSGLLYTILEEIPYYSGILKVNGSIAFVQQEPFIFAQTVRQNIIFGKQYEEEFYNKVVKACCLESDFKIFPNGDKTILGERGITISGGQKVRLSLARAVYSQSDIYLLDDPISAVDAKVARKLYDNVINGILNKKTILFVTHQLHYLSECDNVLMMEQGQIKHCGTPIQLEREINKLMLISHQQENYINYENDNIITHKFFQKNKTMNEIQDIESDGKVIKSSEQQVIRVNFASYIRYILYNRIKVLFPLVLLMFLCSEGINIAFFRILTQYDQVKANASFINFQNFWIILVALQFSFLIFLIIKYFLLYYLILKSNENMHEDMLLSLLRSPSQYFDRIPSGRLINRFSNDLSIMDTVMAFTYLDAIQYCILFLLGMINVFQVIPFYIPIGLVQIAFIIYLYFYCKNGIIQTKLLDLKMKTPLFSHLNAMIGGITDYKTYGQIQAMNQRMKQIINNSTRASFSFILGSRIFGVYITYACFLSSFIALFIGIGYTQPGIYGMALVQLLQFSQIIQLSTRQLVFMESYMVSIIRVQNIINLTQQAPLRTEYDKTIGFFEEIQNERSQLNHIKSKWPKKASIEFRNYTMRYQEDLDPVLKNLNLEIKEGQKVGIVGRTGAGKSSIVQALFRMTEGDQGSQIFIDGCNIRQMGLHSLRSNLSIIPQSPFLFKGTIRQNIDPFGEQSQEHIWQALEESDLKGYVEKLPQRLDTELSNVNEAFSVGQKQLICLARAILKKNKILVLDEATANVDMGTDKFIQNTLKTKFKQQTVITIAHRLNTIADYDRVIVMDKGRIVQNDSPFKLLVENPNDIEITRKGLFADMVNNTGHNAKLIFEIAKLHHFKKLQ